MAFKRTMARIALASMYSPDIKERIEATIKSMITKLFIFTIVN
jgi:fumarate reductase subunit D